MNRIFLILVVVASLVLLVNIVSAESPEKNQPSDRIPVTGCPYGDSIPLGDECDKHKPVVEETTTTPVVREQTQVFQGK